MLVHLAFKPAKWSWPTMLSTVYVPWGMNLNIRLSVIGIYIKQALYRFPLPTTAGLVNMIISRKTVMLIGL